MQPWLDRPDIEAVIEELPDSFPFAKLKPKVELLVKGWLTDLIGKDKVAELKAAFETQYETSPEDPDFQPDPLTDEQQAWQDLIKPFLSLASWSQYILNSNVSITKTGPVTKRSDSSDPIDQDQREALSRNYYNQAKEWAVRISAKAAENTNACTSNRVGSKRTSVKVLRGNSNSYFIDGPYRRCCE